METDEPTRKVHGDRGLYGNDFDAGNYNLSGKIMLTAIIILFFVIVLMLCLHLYSRWNLHRARNRHLRRRRLRRAQLVFYVDSENPTDAAAAAAAAVVASRGLDASVIALLPVFTYSPKTHPEPVDCAVCLSEFEEGETGRVLPKCGHSFHTDCIDMWFHSHSTCPLCRSPVEPASPGENRPEVVITVCEPGSSSGLCEECRNGEEEANRTGQAVSSSSIGLRRKPSSLVDITVEVPARNGSFGDESGRDSPSIQSSFRSPMSRMLSFKRMLSRDRKGSTSPSVGYSSVTEIEPERVGPDETQ